MNKALKTSVKPIDSSQGKLCVAMWQKKREHEQGTSEGRCVAEMRNKYVATKSSSDILVEETHLLDQGLTCSPHASRAATFERFASTAIIAKRYD